MNFGYSSEKMQRGGSCQFSTPVQQTGGNCEDLLDISIKKERLRRSSSVGNLPKKLSNYSDTVKYASVPRKMRSALEKRQHESQKTYAPDSKTDTEGFDLQLKDCAKKHKTNVAIKDSKQSLITKDEEEAAQALSALAQTITNTCLNKTLEVEQLSVHMVPVTNETEYTHGKNMSQKRCLVHVHICWFIKVLQTNESEGANANVMCDTSSICSH